MKIRCFVIMISFFLSIADTSKAQQNQTFHNQMQFAGYLFKNNLLYDCTTFIKTQITDPSLSSDQKDSLFYFAGNVFYKEELYDSAIFYFNNVSNKSEKFEESALFSAYSLAVNSKFDESIKKITSIKTAPASGQEFRNFQLSGVYLLSRDTSNFRIISKDFTFNQNYFSSEEKKMFQLATDIKKLKHKSGLLAGMMSAVVPGLGKIYAGKPKQGITSFLPVILLSVQALEAYSKAGLKSPRFILSAGIFSVFYIADIWGSILSVSVKRNEINNEINNQILFNMRIPLHRISGKI